MADENGRRFEDTMDVLEAEREATEVRFRELLDTLTQHVVKVREATDRSTALYQAQVEERRQALASVRDGLTGAAADCSPNREVTWPVGGGLRGLLNRMTRWVMRDYLEVLDRRRAVHTRRVEDLKDRVDRLQGTVSTDSETATAVNEALGNAHAALQAALATHAEMLNLVNAKDAEVLQRAVAGPLRRMEVLFDEFGRQQEALLSQLIGRRHELDELVQAVTAAPKEEM